MQEIVNIPVENIKVGKNALRMEFEEGTLDSISASIRRIGILVPLVVSKRDNGFCLIAGHRRLAAAIRVGMGTVPCIVRMGSEADAKEVSFAENLFRQDLTPIEVAGGIKDILEQKTMTKDELAAVMHRSKHWVISMVNMLAWPDDVLEAIHAGWLSISAGSNIALIGEDTYRAFLLKNAYENGVSARTTAAWLQAWRSMTPPEEAVEREPGPAERASVPAVPQAPCYICGEPHRTDGLAYIAVCLGCVGAIRGVRTGG